MTKTISDGGLGINMTTVNFIFFFVITCLVAYLSLMQQRDISFEKNRL